MTRVIRLTPQAFYELSQALDGKRYINLELADAGYENLALDAYGDWVVTLATEEAPAGTVQTKEAVLGAVVA